MLKKSKILDFLKLLRLNNALIGGFGVFVSYLLVNSKVCNFDLYLGIVSVMFVMFSGNIINDYFDVETDRINKPERPLIKRNLKIKTVLYFYVFFILISTFISFFLSKLVFLITVFSNVILFFYSFKIKRIPFCGNFIISLLTALLFVFGAEIGGDVKKSLFPAIFSFLMTLGREILKDIEDVDGDRYIGRKTIPIVIGKTGAFFLTVFIFIILIFTTFLPYFSGLYNRVYMLIAFFGVDLFIIILLFIFYLFPDTTTKKSVNDLIKYDMLVGLIAIFLGGR